MESDTHRKPIQNFPCFLMPSFIGLNATLKATLNVFLGFLGLGLGFSFFRFLGLGLGLGLGLNNMDLVYVCMSRVLYKIL
jgi:hypothetical protein